MDFALPDGLLAHGYRLRAEVERDIPFLQGLYASTREQELSALSDWSVADKRAFCDQQFAAQRLHYRSHIPSCIYQMVLCDGEPVGRLYIEERVTQVHVVDIALMPSHRGRGIGTALLLALADAAAARGKGIGIFVERYNPALRLYHRLGFVPVSQTDIYLEMERLVDAPPQLVS
jgi:ribosomal protein S18 acetylase RimI-like enzyme